MIWMGRSAMERLCKGYDHTTPSFSKSVYYLYLSRQYLPPYNIFIILYNKRAFVITTCIITKP